MSEPLKDTPLALLDRKSVKMEDCVENELYGFSPVHPEKPLVN